MGRANPFIGIGVFAATLGGLNWALGNNIDPQILCISGVILFLIGIILEVMS